MSATRLPCLRRPTSPYTAGRFRSELWEGNDRAGDPAPRIDGELCGDSHSTARPHTPRPRNLPHGLPDSENGEENIHLLYIHQ